MEQVPILVRAGQHEVGPAAQLAFHGGGVPHDAQTDLAVGEQPVSQHALDVLRVVDDELVLPAEHVADERIHPRMREHHDVRVARPRLCAAFTNSGE